MAFINVAEWSPENVADWLKGLDDCILPYVQFFLNNNINGCRLLLLSSDDLNNLNVTKIGHHELILEAVDLLKHLHYNFGSETLQSLALRLGCKSRSLYNQLKHDDLNDDISKLERVSTPTLSGVSEILSCVKSFISWIDRYPFEGQDQYIPVRKTILRLSIELASTAQRDQFVDKPNDVIKTSCITLAELCDRIVQELIDSLAIQPAVLDIVTVKKKTDEDLGMHIHSSYSGTHIVGGIKFQSPCHRCGRIAEGDEIVQVCYQTVVGWQLKKLVNAMKEYPTEIVLTIKKRPRHSNIMGQVIVLKPYKIPSRKSTHRSHGLTGANRVKNASTTTVAESDEDDAFLPDGKHPKPPKGPVYQMLNRRPKLQVKRRATISGASPTTGQPPVRIEDLVEGMRNKKDSVGRSISHDPAKQTPKHYTRGLSNEESSSLPQTQVPIVTNKSAHLSPKLPYAKVFPIPIEDNYIDDPTLCNIKKYDQKYQTTPKRVQSPKDKKKQLFHKKEEQNPYNERSLSEVKNISSLQHTSQIGNVGVVNPNPVTVLSYQFLSDIIPRNKETVNSHSVDENRTKVKRELRVNDDAPALRPRTKARAKHSSRRISCKDLGEGDCHGWLYQRKDQHGFLVPSVRWQKRWVVLKNSYLYCYKSADEIKASCLIHLPGFTVSPTICKSKKHAFKLYNPNTSIHFASESQTDMSKWMNKMGLAAISYISHSDLHPQAFCYSETEESEDGESPSINRTKKFITQENTTPSSSTSVMQYRETSPESISTSSSSDTNSIKRDIYGRSPLSSTSSSTSTSSIHDPQTISVKPAYPSAAKPPHKITTNVQKSPSFRTDISIVQSGNCIDGPEVSIARNRRQLSDLGSTKYAKIIFPTPSSSSSVSSVKDSSPQIPPRGPKLSLSSNISSDSGSLDRQRLNLSKEIIASGPVSKVSGSFANVNDEHAPEPSKSNHPVPPRPQPRTSKLNIKKDDVTTSGIVAKLTDSFDKLSKEKITSLNEPKVSPRPELKPKISSPIAARAKNDETYEYVFKPKISSPIDARAKNDESNEYVFKPTMAMVKTGIVNPLYERVHNKSWSSGHSSSLPRGMTGKNPMPLPSELNAHQQNYDLKKSPSSSDGLTLLDREYNRIFGTKSPEQLISSPPLSKSPTLASYPMSATSLEIENLYTYKPRTVNRTFDIDNHNQRLSPSIHPRSDKSKYDRPQTPSSSDNSMSSSSGISSYYSTYLEIPAEKRIVNSKGSASSYQSAISSPTIECQTQGNVLDSSHPLSSPESTSKPNKSPTKSSSFRLFSSPKLLKKLSTPKYTKERNHEKRDVNKIVAEDSQKTTKTSRLFLGSPKLTRAIFGNTNKKLNDQKSNSDTKVKSGISAYCQTEESFVRDCTLNRSSSDSSVTSSAVSSHHIVEKKINKPQLTIALPLLTETYPGIDASDLPLTPETPRKPTMGVAMIGKRRPSNAGCDKGAIEIALQQYGSGSLTNQSSCSSRTGYTTEDTDDEWANIVRTIEHAGLTLEDEPKQKPNVKPINKTIDDEQLCHLVLSLRALQKTLKNDKKQEYDAIDELLNQPITVDRLELWMKKYPLLLPQDYA